MYPPGGYVQCGICRKLASCALPFRSQARSARQQHGDAGRARAHRSQHEVDSSSIDSKSKTLYDKQGGEPNYSQAVTEYLELWNERCRVKDVLSYGRCTSSQIEGTVQQELQEVECAMESMYKLWFAREEYVYTDAKEVWEEQQG